MTKKIDIFAHILPPKYIEKYAQYNPKVKDRVEFAVKSMYDLDVRTNLMRRNPDVLQVVTVGNIPLEKFCPEHSPELARMVNDELAEILVQRPDLFFGAVAAIPINDVDASLKEIDYAMNELKLSGIQVYTRVGTEWLADKKYYPIFELMAKLDKPIWIHPDTHDTSIDNDFGLFSWSFETTLCMLRLVQAGIFTDFPNIKIITHHAGAMVPVLKERIKFLLKVGSRLQAFPGIAEHFKKFYVDTAIYGNTDGLMCAYNYYGVDHLLFGTDAPLGPGGGGVTGGTLESVECMAIPPEDKERILRKNAIDILLNTT